jgi:hypothetical protein
MNREIHVRICESLRGQFPRATRPSTLGIQAAFSSWFRGCEIALLRSARSGFR